MGLFARSVEDVAFLGDQLMVFDACDPDMRHRAAPRLLETAASEPPVTPRFAFVKTPVWDQAEEDAQAAFEELAERLGGEIVEEVELPGPFNSAIEWHQVILESNLARNFETEYERGKDRLSDLLRKMMERGKTYLAVDYTRAVEKVPVLNGLLGEIFERFDAPAHTAGAGAGAARAGRHGESRFLHHLDLVRNAGRDASTARGGGRDAARCSARGAQGRRRQAAPDGAVARIPSRWVIRQDVNSPRVCVTYAITTEVRVSFLFHPSNTRREI